jgi:hypothetical protein
MNHQSCPEEEDGDDADPGMHGLVRVLNDKE